MTQIFLKEKIKESDVVMNNTGLGMPSSLDGTPIPMNIFIPDNYVLMQPIIRQKLVFLLRLKKWDAA